MRSSANPEAFILKKVIYGVIFCCVFAGLFLFLLNIFLSAGLIRPSYSMHGFDFILDKDILFRYKPDSKGGINSRGYRTPEFSDKKTKKRVVFMGDSFVMGMEIEPEEAIPARLNDMLGDEYEVINTGVLGYGPDQNLVLLRKEILNLDPDLVILGVFPGNDFLDVVKNKLVSYDSMGVPGMSRENIVTELYPDLGLGYFRDYVRHRSGKTDPKLEKLFIKFFGDLTDYNMILDRQSELFRFRVKGMYFVLKEFKDTLQKADVPFFLVTFPYYDSIESDEFLIKNGVDPKNKFFLDQMMYNITDQLGIPNLLIYPLFINRQVNYSRYTSVSYHFSPEGAEEIAGYIRQYMHSRSDLP